MQNVSFDNDDSKDVLIERPPQQDTPTKSEIVQWLAENKIIKTSKQGRFVVIIGSILIIVISAFIFSYGIGKRQANDIETTGNVYLKTE